MPIRVNQYPPIFIYSIATFFALVYILSLFIELNTKAIVIQIQSGFLTKRSFVGLGSRSIYKFDEIDGYKTTVHHNYPHTQEYLYLIKSNKRIVKLSEAYHTNYQELKQVFLNHNLKNLGVEDWSLIRHGLNWGLD